MGEHDKPGPSTTYRIDRKLQSYRTYFANLPPRSSQAPHQQAQKTQHPISLPSLIQRYLCMSMMCVWDLPWTYVLPSKTTIRKSERRKSKSWPSQLASKKWKKRRTERKSSTFLRFIDNKAQLACGSTGRLIQRQAQLACAAQLAVKFKRLNWPNNN